MTVVGNSDISKLLKGLVHVFVILAFFCCTENQSVLIHNSIRNPIGKTNGISLVGPPKEIDSSWTTDVKSINANWVAIIPYAFCDDKTGDISYGEKVTHYQWWGERPQGVCATICHAKIAGLKVMVKPHLWIPGSWPGSFQLKDEASWKNWELQYEAYVLQLASIADSMSADVFCIGTELRFAANERPDYWRSLIRKVRAEFNGPLTFAANWDNYNNITFWNDLDYIGIDAYFPLSENSTPSIDELIQAWKPIKKNIHSLSQKYNKPVLFAEYGYRSIDKAAWRNWEVEDNYELPVNLKAQEHAYEAIYQSFWGEEWFAGGFLWKWYNNDLQSGGLKNTDYTPQNKPVERIMKYYHEKHSGNTTPKTD